MLESRSKHIRPRTVRACDTKDRVTQTDTFLRQMEHGAYPHCDITGIICYTSDRIDAFSQQPKTGRHMDSITFSMRIKKRPPNYTLSKDLAHQLRPFVTCNYEIKPVVCYPSVWSHVKVLQILSDQGDILTLMVLRVIGMSCPASSSSF